MTTLRLILGDQLSFDISSLKAAKPTDVIMLCEVWEEATYVKHHQLKIAFLFSAMRHFAYALKKKKYHVHYVKLDDPHNSHSFTKELSRAIKKFNPDNVIVTEAAEYRVREGFFALQKKLSCPMDILADDRFFCSTAYFNHMAQSKKQLRMENFYRHMRVKHRILLNEDDTPVGGKWNFDKDNRKPIKANLKFPPRMNFAKDKITKEVLTFVQERFSDHFGNLEHFYFAVNRRQALQLLKQFVSKILPNFGDFQDAMTTESPFLYHSVLSPYINAGLLSAQEVCAAAEQAYRQGEAPLNAVEGFIRQILGWREYMRGVYWLKMPEYAKLNYFNAKRKLPKFYWDGNTSMRCLQTAITQTLNYAYSHHIQRLMVTGNFALLAGLDPKAVCEWYLLVYADAYEWVELPNTLGMALFGDGGFLGSKPYAASGKYIQRMSNFCEQCAFNPKDTVGEKACPFNSLYWHFLAKNHKSLKNNLRMVYPYATWAKMAAGKKQEILAQAETFLKTLSV